MIPLPQHHHEDDTKWITQQLTRIPHAMRAATAERYSTVYHAEYCNHQGQAYAHCRARFAANTRLREFVERVLATMGGAVVRPDAVGVEMQKPKGFRLGIAKVGFESQADRSRQIGKFSNGAACG